MFGLNGTSGDFWVFGYASLMWNPGFVFEEAVKAHLFGYHRTLCVHSRHYRGTPERSGLVMGLDRGGSCVGVAFRVDAKAESVVRAYLRQREMISAIYHERMIPVRVHDGRAVHALAYVVDTSHEQFAGHLSIEAAASVIRGAAGTAGTNEEYVLNTIKHLREIGIRDHWLEGVSRLIGEG